MENREQIETRLRSYIGELMEVRKIPDYQNLAKYQKLQMQIPTYIWKYAEILFPNGISLAERGITCFVRDSGLEIMEFARDFVDSFEDNSSEEDGALHYIAKILKQKIIHEGSEKAKDEKRQGIKKSKNKTDESHDRRYAELVKICVSNGKNIRDEGVSEWLSAQTGKKISKIKELIDEYAISVSQESLKTHDGEKISIFDTFEVDSIYTTAKERLLREKNFTELFKSYLEKIETYYQNARPQPKKDGFLSAVVTRWLLAKFNDLSSLREVACDLISNYEFADKDLLENWKNGEKLPEQKEISQSKGRDKTKAAQVLKPFKAIFEEGK